MFIDESPSILNERNGLGIEALKTLLKRIDDYKDRLIVILAGTHQYMIQMIEAIPNLQTRLKNVFEFPNYSSEELFDIFNIHLSSNNFSMSEKAAIRMRKILDDAFTNKQCSGNGHFVSTLYDRVISNQASRLAQSSNLTIEELTLITENDLKDII